jgi:hypothetical protein
MLVAFIVLVLIGHGLIVAAQARASFGISKSPPANPDWLRWWPVPLGRSWLLAKTGLSGGPLEKALGVVWLLSGLCLVAAGFGFMDVVVPLGAWPALVVIGAAGALVMLLLYLHPFYFIGILVDIAVPAYLLGIYRLAGVF